MCDPLHVIYKDFNFSIELVFHDNPWQNITYHLSRSSQDKYQIILVDSNGNVEASQSLAEKLQKKWEKQYEPYGFYFWIERSGTGPPSAIKKAGNIFGFLFLLGIVGALVYLAVMKYKKTTPTLPAIDINTLSSRIVQTWNSSIRVSMWTNIFIFEI